MVTTLCLLACTLMPAQELDRPTPPSRAPGQPEHWLLSLRLRPNLELVYRGLYRESSSSSGAHHQRTYRFSNRLLVLTTSKRNLEVAFLTTYRDRHTPGLKQPVGQKQSTLRSVRLSKVQINYRGVVQNYPGVPIEGPPALEVGTFVPFPLKRITLQRTWTQKDGNLPVRIWRALKTEVVNGARCLKIQGTQQSPDWDRPRADSTAWKRVDTVWVSPLMGIAYRVERVIERRLPGRTKPTHRSSLSYDLDSKIQYNQLAEDRRLEIQRTEDLGKTAEPMLSNPGRYKRQLTTLESQIGAHLKQHPPTPYQVAMLQLLDRIKAGLRGEIPAVLPASVTSAYPTTAAQASPGKLAPNFSAVNLKTSKLDQLTRWKGKPVLMVFYRPESRTLFEVMYFAWKLKYKHRKLTVLAMSMSDDKKKVSEQAKRMRISFPILSGSGLRSSYNIEATPKLMLIDGKGVVRAEMTGWGPTSDEELMEKFTPWLKK